MIRALLLIVCAMSVPAQEIYDLLLKNGTVVDPGNSRTGRLDVAVTAGKISRVAQNIPAVQARTVVDVGGYYVTPGLIDLHAHLGSPTADQGVQPDYNSLPYGVTTVVDVEGRQSFHSRVRVLRLADAIRFVDGFSEKDRDELLKKLRPGDILSGIYANSVPEVWMAAAQKRGVVFDVGPFRFRAASEAIRKGFLPDTISTGMDRPSVLLQRANMSVTMSKFLNLGLTIEQIIDRTTARAARAIRHPELGTLSDRSAADIAVLAVEKGTFGFLDSAHQRLAADRQVRCVLTVRDGTVLWDSDGLFAPDSERIGPYSNFK